MKYIAVSLLALLLASCSDDSPLPVDSEKPGIPVEAEAPDEYQEKIRTVPYPRSCNEIFINPAPLIVPRNMATGEALVFQLSSSPDFPTDRTTTSEPQKWNMFNIHRELPAGRWYWRFCNVDQRGNHGEWSETYDFEVTAAAPCFVTPAYDRFASRLPRSFPRIHCYTSATVDDARKEITSNPEYKALISRASEPLNTDYANISSHYGNAQNLAQQISYLYQAYYLTQRQEYADKLLQVYKSFVADPPATKMLYSSNFTTSHLLYTLAACYDICHVMADEGTRAAAARWMADVICKGFDSFRGYEENHIFDNHFWQHNYRNFFQATLVLHDDPVEGPRVQPMLEYLYEIWTSRAPAGGFNRDGLWHNGAGYFNANIQTLCYMPVMLSYITGHDFFGHPWYQNAGRAISFTMPPQGTNIGFGDGSESRQEPHRQVASFADIIACHTGDAYASWYASQTATLIPQDIEMRIYRVCRGLQHYSTVPDDQQSMLQWNKDCGEVAMHSSLFNVADDLALGFRSSTFGSGSHTTASQNAFNIAFAGHDVFRSSGYYQNFSDAHNLMSYRHSRAHNTILINGIGQPYSTQGWGRILRAGGGADIAYALGDASHAYCGVTTDPMWISAFEAAGIEQTPENGFGRTPLARYLRHVAMLGSDAIVIYDEIEASEVARIDWLLHSKYQFDISSDNSDIKVAGSDIPYHAGVTLLCSSTPAIAQTDRWTVAPAIQGDQYPPQWHLKATVSAAKVRYLAVIQVADKGHTPGKVVKTGDGVSINGWEISAQLNTDLASSLVITNPSKNAALSYGSLPVVINGNSYGHNSPQSTVIVENVNGSPRYVELTNRQPLSTRNG